MSIRVDPTKTNIKIEVKHKIHCVEMPFVSVFREKKSKQWKEIDRQSSLEKGYSK